MTANAFSIALGWLLDLILGDPRRLPHPVVWFGKMIAIGEKNLNKGTNRRAKGAFLSISLILLVFGCACGLRSIFGVYFDVLTVFYCLAGTTLIKEVRAVFAALERSLDEGRQQVARIVGRDTSKLSAQEVRTAALETLAENLSDGVIAPLFWLLIFGTPTMLAYKMVNTLDSMIGYRTERYQEFGCVAARIDDFANYLPARLTAFLMVVASGRIGLLRFVRKYGRSHASPNSGYPEAALAGILDCQFGGPHDYFGMRFDKPYIGNHARELTLGDMKKAIRINRMAEILMVLIVIGWSLFMELR